MLGFIKKLFGSKPAETVAEAPYKVETLAPAVPDFPVEKPAKAAKPKAEKKPAAKKTTARKPKTPKA
jgi:SepF-like predicted cell division protein (DUF552 family)